MTIDLPGGACGAVARAAASAERRAGTEAGRILRRYAAATMSQPRRARTRVHAMLCAMALTAASALCRADGPWSGTLGATTDYVFRGVSQSYGGAALQAGVNYQGPVGWVAGAWASNVDPYPFRGDSAEINLYSGFGWALGRDWTARAAYTRYLYAWERRPARYDYGELSLTLGFEDRLAATISYQPDSTRYAAPGYVRDRPASAYELTGRWPLPRNFALVGGVGYYDLTRLYGVGYWSGSAGASYVRGRFEVDLTRFFSDATVRRLFGDASADGRWVATAVWRF
jgi:uncharacterized protein (TIGR02001 family)